MALSPKELAEEISNFVNSTNQSKIDELVKLMAQDHPTLQQSKMRLACQFIEAMANKEHVDARNETSRKTAKAMIKGYKDMAKQEIIEQDGGISNSLSTFIDEKALPSGSLPTI